MRKRGITLVEFCVALVVGLPLVLSMLYVVVEASILFAIRTNINTVARRAAVEMSRAYARDPSIRNDRNQQQALYTKIRLPGYVVDNRQFSDPPIFDDGPPGPHTVTVVVSYPAGGKYGLPQFPNPDPLNLTNQFVITTAASFAL